MLLGYNTNGFAHHHLEDALGILAGLDYRSIALTIDYHALNPASPMLSSQVENVWTLLQRYSLRVVIETGARFLLDPWRKHQPTLLDPNSEARKRRVDFLCRCIDIADALGADAVSFWSGKSLSDESDDILWPRLVDGCRTLCGYAEKHNVRLAFEPEPGMFIDTMDRYEQLFDQVKHPLFGLTLDIGHLYCLGEDPIRPHLARWKDVLWNIHLEDMKPGIHDHLFFGEGVIDFADVFAELRNVNYTGGLHVELSRHSHDAVETARKAMTILSGLLSAMDHNNPPEAMECRTSRPSAS